MFKIGGGTGTTYSDTIKIIAPVCYSKASDSELILF